MKSEKAAPRAQIFFSLQFSRFTFHFLFFTGAFAFFSQPLFGQTAPVFSPTFEINSTLSPEPAGSLTSKESGTTAQEESPLLGKKPFFSPTTVEAGSQNIQFSTTTGEKSTLPPPLDKFSFGPTEWKNVSVGLLAGLYHPSLDTLNNILHNSNVGILQDPNFLLPGNPDLPVSKRNIIAPNLFGLAEYGAELQIDINPKYAFIFTFSTYSAESRAEDQVTIFTRSNQPPAVVPRDARYNVTVNQFWWGLKYHLINDPGKKTFYLNIGLLGIAGAYLTMDSLERVITPSLSFDSVSVTEASGWGFTNRFGAGGEYRIQKWLSIGGRVNYVVGKVSTLTVTRFFPSGFGQPPDTPPDALPPAPSVPIPQPVHNPVPGDSITYANMQTVGAADIITSTPQNVSIDLDGFEMLLFIHFHF
ncbi:MAG TPA: hypothetical protein VN944_11390 [Nitrospiria bacterium]|nr:hypothetical protein [Nitrospiria bacterium]